MPLTYPAPRLTPDEAKVVVGLLSAPRRDWDADAVRQLIGGGLHVGVPRRPGRGTKPLGAREYDAAWKRARRVADTSSPLALLLEARRALRAPEDQDEALLVWVMVATELQGGRAETEAQEAMRQVLGMPPGAGNRPGARAEPRQAPKTW